MSGIENGAAGPKEAQIHQVSAVNADAKNPTGLRADKLNVDWLSGFVDGDGSITF